MIPKWYTEIMYDLYVMNTVSICASYIINH